MFTGIIKELGIVTEIKKVREGIKFSIKSKKVIKSLKVSDSVAINGICHTVTNKSKNKFEFISVPETLKKTNIGELTLNEEVNLENSLKVGEQIGGHFVFGHIDDVGIISSIKKIKSKSNRSYNFEFGIRINKKYKKYIINVGSISINGVSLTIAKIFPSRGKHFDIKVAIIPYTYKHTTFKNLQVKDKVNVEFDFIGKYVKNIIDNKLKK
ncbi:MAG: riboflavin synthase [Ignavibacteria bacterium]